jgi:hypothetical protein
MRKGSTLDRQAATAIAMRQAHGLQVKRLRLLAVTPHYFKLM